jgi:hypothetical protein
LAIFSCLVFSINIEGRMGGGGGEQHHVLRVKEPKKTGAYSARVRTRGQNPLVGARR